MGAATDPRPRRRRRVPRFLRPFLDGRTLLSRRALPEVVAWHHGETWRRLPAKKVRPSRRCVYTTVYSARGPSTAAAFAFFDRAGATTLAHSGCAAVLCSARPSPVAKALPHSGHATGCAFSRCSRSFFFSKKRSPHVGQGLP